MISVFHDSETYGELDLKDVGAYRYMMHPSTEMLMLSWQPVGESPRMWAKAEGESMPAELKDMARDASVIWHAYNAQFERLGWKHLLGIEIPINRFRCTMAHAWHCGFSGTLDQVGQQLGLPAEKRKDKHGRDLIRKFCKPAGWRSKVKRFTHKNAPADWAAFKEYCRQDVVAESEIELLLEGYPFPPVEQALWEWDQRVNDRGVPIDMALVERACQVVEEEKRNLFHKLQMVTGLNNPNSTTQLLDWFKFQGYPLPNLQEETLLRWRSKMEQQFELDVLNWRLQISRTSTSKWEAFKRATGEDGRLRGMFQFGGAQRTQRWAGRIVQLQNLKSPETDHIVESAELIYEDTATIRALWGDPMEFLSQTIRCAITAGDGKTLVACDLSSIESRVLGYISGCHRINACFAEGRDTYRDFAQYFYGVPYAEVTKAQRKFCKPPVLGAGYQLGAGTMVDYAAGMGVVMDKDTAQAVVTLWRETYPEVPAMWYWLVEATHDVVENWTVWEGYHVRLHRDRNFLMIQLPSGRNIYYYQPMILMQIPPWEREKIEAGEITEEQAARRPTLTYMGMDQYTKQWTRLNTHGGKITENIVQAIARDILAWQMHEMELQGFNCTVGHLHDEAVAEVPLERADEALKYMRASMSVTPPWAPGLLLGAAAYVSRRFKKD